MRCIQCEAGSSSVGPGAPPGARPNRYGHPGHPPDGVPHDDYSLNVAEGPASGLCGSGARAPTSASRRHTGPLSRGSLSALAGDCSMNFESLITENDRVVLPSRLTRLRLEGWSVAVQESEDRWHVTSRCEGAWLLFDVARRRPGGMGLRHACRAQRIATNRLSVMQEDPCTPSACVLQPSCNLARQTLGELPGHCHKSLIYWSRRSGLNRRPADYESAALPLSYAGRAGTSDGSSDRTRGTASGQPGS